MYMWKRLAPVVAISALIVAGVSCKARQFNQGARTKGAGTEGGQIIVQCNAPQGNGGNWASFLGWLSEQWRVRARDARSLEKSSGSAIKLDLRCMSGKLPAFIPGESRYLLTKAINATRELLGATEMGYTFDARAN